MHGCILIFSIYRRDLHFLMTVEHAQRVEFNLQLPSVGYITLSSMSNSLTYLERTLPLSLTDCAGPNLNVIHGR